MSRFSILVAWLAMASPAGAHRLDEYLQATRLSVDTDHVDVEMDLTPGVALASTAFGWIDRDRDGRISEAEGDAYAREVLRSVVLKVDGWPVPVTLVESNFPSLREMSLGVGTIRLRATAKIPAAREGRHQIAFLNTHRPESSVYLVNALVPVNPHIQLGEQRRDVEQHGLTFDYQVSSDGLSATDRASALLLALLLAAGLFWRLRKSTGIAAKNATIAR